MKTKEGDSISLMTRHGNHLGEGKESEIHTSYIVAFLQVDLLRRKENV